MTKERGATGPNVGSTACSREGTGTAGGLWSTEKEGAGAVVNTATHLSTVLGFGGSHEEFQHWLGLRDQGGHRVDDCSEFGGGL